MGILAAGDVRMGVAENPHKIENLVLPHLARFRTLYQPAIAELERLKVLQSQISPLDSNGFNFTASTYCAFRAVSPNVLLM